MPKKADNDDYIISDTGNWNVAAAYVAEKIMKPLIKCDIYEDLAERGYESIAEEIMGWQSPPNDMLRIKGLKWLISELIRLIYNSKFALRKKGTKEEIMGYKKDLDQINKIIPNLTRYQFNSIEGTRVLKIKDEVFFSEVLEAVKLIKSKINEPLNKNHLIFTETEEFDPIAYKKQIFDNATQRG